VGSRNGHKNFIKLLSSFASSEKLRSDFDLIAFGGGGFNVNETKLIGELGFRTGQVRQMGGDDSMLAMFYRQATAFVYPSFYEGFGLPPLEAMAQGCPVISSNSSSMPEVIGDAGEYFDPNSIEDMAAAIERVAYSKSRRDNLIELGKARLGVFSWNKCATETLRIYKHLV
jgi:glycosyltransferase involved in cell wall biosynthesis